MRIKVAGVKSPGNDRSPATTVVVSTVVTVAAMFAARLTAAQQTVFRTGRGPRVYNALITSDQRLLPSQADPILTPAFPPFLYGGWPYAFAPSFSALEPAAAVVETLDLTAAGHPDGDVPPERRPPPPPPPPAVKNNRPAGSTVPDVPPPPVPGATTNKQDKKKPEEYPPPPVGFAI